MAEGFEPPSELLRYLAEYEVVVCIRCKYAIQPAGIARHLKDIHHILRAARHPYTAYAETLVLKDPDKVVPPQSPNRFPVPDLPVEQGWRCAAPGCDYKCVSVKRMETHWPATHDRKGISKQDWIACPLQTFFRGNMLRYFTCQEASLRNTTSSDNRSQISVDTNEEVNASAVSFYLPRLRVHYAFDALDNVLLEHYFSSSYRNFMLDDASLPIWLETVPGIATENRFLIHGMLACTALHMAHLDPSLSDTYTMRAYCHQEVAIPLYRYAIEHPSKQNCNALVSFAYMLVVYTFATDTDSSNRPLFLVDDSGSELGGEQLIIPHWLHFIRAGCSMLCHVWDHVETGPVRALAYGWEVEPGPSSERSLYLNYFLSIIPQDSSWSAEDITTYSRAASMLAESLAHLEEAGHKRDFTTWQVLGVWPARVEDDYVTLLSRRHPGALILLAYYCIMLMKINGLWYFTGRPAKLLSSILRILDQKWHPVVKTAVDQVLPERA
ncbi:Orsellinic acid/F9775 biosynthesis cluster protein D [Paramyrothecium foliicola]|nr:Orsellinic acid/F9775 biosynthesis cluster protein D [Paramyrothecium foliicola]